MIVRLHERIEALEALVQADAATAAEELDAQGDDGNVEQKEDL